MATYRISKDNMPKLVDTLRNEMVSDNLFRAHCEQSIAVTDNGALIFVGHTTDNRLVKAAIELGSIVSAV